jgi:hypothetical protein
MLKQISKLEIQIENKPYTLLCESDSSTQHVKEALFQFGKYIGQIEDAARANAEQNKIEPIPVEEIEQQQEV